MFDEHSWDGVGEVQVQFLKENFNLNNSNIVATFDEGFEFRTNEQYPLEEVTNEDGSKKMIVAASDLERFKSERDTKVTYDMLEDGDKLVVYKNPLTAGTHNITGGFTLKFPNAAILQDGTYCDVTMSVSNIQIKTNRATTKPIFLVRSSTSTKRMWNGIGHARQESEEGKQFFDIGASYDLEFKVTKAGTDEVVKGAVGISFRDIDVGDKTDNRNINGTYAESITIMTPLFEGEKIHRVPNSAEYLEILDTEFGTNTKFKAIKNQNFLDDTERRKAGFATRVNADDFKYRWTGSHAEMEIGFFLPHKVTTSTSGEYPNNVVITPTDDKVLWKEDKSIEMTPNKDFYISKITIDDVEITYKDLTKNSDGTSKYEKDGITYNFTEKDGKVTYIFNDVIKDHKIDVQVQKKEIVDKPDDNPKTGVISKIVIISLLLITSAVSIFMVYKKRNSDAL